MALRGKIIKATGGFYYVRPHEGGEVLECRARGLFRRDNITPLVGDNVTCQIDTEQSGTVVDIDPRKNGIVRPPLANLDYMVAVLSVRDPAPNLLVVDRFLALLEIQDIPAIVAVTKNDLGDAAPLAALYRKAGYPVHIVNARSGEGVAELASALSGKVSAFSGNSGVGKSSLLNAIDPRFAIEVGSTSKKLGRGKHTTRHTELFELADGALIADTPGFSSIGITEMGGIDREALAGCFREFADYTEHCQFADCAHTCEKGCAVLAAVQDGRIDAGRHKNYIALYNEVKDVKPWMQK